MSCILRNQPQRMKCRGFVIGEIKKQCVYGAPAGIEPATCVSMLLNTALPLSYGAAYYRRPSAETWCAGWVVLRAVRICNTSTATLASQTSPSTSWPVQWIIFLTVHCFILSLFSGLFLALYLHCRASARGTLKYSPYFVSLWRTTICMGLALDYSLVKCSPHSSA